LAGLRAGRHDTSIYQELVDRHGFTATYKSVWRFATRLRKEEGLRVEEACGIIVTAPGEEAQVDYGEGPLVRAPEGGGHRRTRLFVLTLGHSRKSVWLLCWKSSAKQWCQLHEDAFRRLGGVPRLVVLDNLKEGVRHPDIYDPAVNVLYGQLLRHYGAEALPARVRDPDRKGKVERGVAHAQGALRGLKFETLEEAQQWLDHWAPPSARCPRPFPRRNRFSSHCRWNRSGTLKAASAPCTRWTAACRWRTRTTRPRPGCWATRCTSSGTTTWSESCRRRTGSSWWSTRASSQEDTAWCLRRDAGRPAA
jgi:transposase